MEIIRTNYVNVRTYLSFFVSIFSMGKWGTSYGAESSFGSLSAGAGAGSMAEMLSSVELSVLRSKAGRTS